MSTVSQKPIYESYTMYHPSGVFMCHISQKKFDWYLKKNLAVATSDNSCKLTFEPNGVGRADNSYYSQKFKNCCVVCGATEHLNKHHVVPSVFRSRLPLMYKESNHHDIVAVCASCHEAYEQTADVLKESIASQYGAKYNSNHHIAHRKITSAKELLGNPRVPESAKERLRIVANSVAPSNAAWADVVMSQINTPAKIEAFLTMWRSHFLEHAKPRYMPKYWSLCGYKN